ncbi:Uu.00g078730.m01.CDS01 [Anthostomella pinea]|uniref:Uu.00g078730.m01.CDS01 n=1 Tax=Anthostomella pinea TaxID=933095 RepID=A0AAI8VLC4_9PEZI|nr:Uu.00g078730.m01.CDS01 [Anthostomella pinea]
MNNQNIFLSNGTCYTAVGKKFEAGNFIPCGNDAFGHHTCCGGGDNCLADNACFGYYGSGYGSSLTYMAGCTDPDYKDATCPDKKGIDDGPWIALTLCDNSDGVWAACSQEGNPTTLQPGSFCSCTDAASATTAFSDSNSLANIASLPDSTGGSIQFFVGHIPTSPGGAGTTATATAQTSISTNSNGETVTVTLTQSATASEGITTGGDTSSGTIGSSSPGETGANGSTGSDRSSGLSSGAKIGIGVGVAGGGSLLLAVIIAIFLYRRRRRRSPSGIENGGPKDKPHPTVPEAAGQAISEADGKVIEKPAAETDGQAVSEADGNAARPWSMRSELEANQAVPSLGEHAAASAVVGTAPGGRVKKSEELKPVAELPGSEGWGHGNGLSREGQTPTGGPGGTTSQVPPLDAGGSAVNPTQAHPPNSQGEGKTSMEGPGQQNWGRGWRAQFEQAKEGT